MLEEVLHYLTIIPGNTYVDGTVGGGGHFLEIVKQLNGQGKLYGFDKDGDAIQELKEQYENNAEVSLFHQSYSEILQACEKGCVDGILLDLGYSSDQLERRGRGFTFQKDEALDMRFDNTDGLTAADIVNTYSKEKLHTIFKEYGEERYASSIAKNIVDARHEKVIETTFELVEIIKKSVPHTYTIKKRHPATKVFQALRIEVNNEFDVIKKGIADSIEALRSGGRLVIITFHSLEDKIVKNTCKEYATDCVCPPKLPECRCKAEAVIKIITRKSVKPTEEEIASNPRARSAQMRVIEKI